MLFGNESISNYTRTNISIWMMMAFQGGILNIGGFMACHRFVSHVTGFATYFGLEFSKHEYSAAWGMLIVPFLFLCGAMISGQLVDIRLKLHKKPHYYVVFGLMFLLLFVVVTVGNEGGFGEFGENVTKSHDYILLAVLCLICGIQNGSITSVSKAVVRTTHLTGITTDLGIGLVRVFHGQKLKELAAGEVRANLMRVGIIFFFGFGSVIGGFTFKKYSYNGFILPTIISGVLFLITLYFDLRPRASNNAKATESFGRCP